MKKIITLFCLCFILFNRCFAQPFTHADTLRGSNGPGRSWWDATKYDLYVKFNLQDSTISGYNIISFKVLKPDSIMQIDLQEPMVIDSFYLTEFVKDYDKADTIIPEHMKEYKIYPNSLN